jgi:hypothetical protein
MGLTMNFTASPEGERIELEIPLHILFLLVASETFSYGILLTILSKSFALIIAITLMPIITLPLDYFLSLVNIIDNDTKPITSLYLTMLDIPSPDLPPPGKRTRFLINAAALCGGLDVSVGSRVLGIDDISFDNFSFDSVCSVGILLAVVIPKGFIEGGIVSTVVLQEMKLLRRLMEYRRSKNVDSDVNGIVEKQERPDSKDEVVEKVQED